MINILLNLFYSHHEETAMFSHKKLLEGYDLRQITWGDVERWKRSTGTDPLKCAKNAGDFLLISAIAFVSSTVCGVLWFVRSAGDGGVIVPIFFVVGLMIMIFNLLMARAYNNIAKGFLRDFERDKKARDFLAEMGKRIRGDQNNS